MLTDSKVESAIKELFATLSFTKEPQRLYEPLKYMIDIGGKHIRPSLCLTTYGLYKDALGEEILMPAAGLELFHSFTLIHDDIMDKSPLRRGKPTVWTQWGEDGAILSGDAMCIDSYKRIAKAPAACLGAVLDLFSTTAAQVCDGQQLDIDFEMLGEVSMDQYMKMIGLKTGVLIACAAKMGALIGGAEAGDCDNLYNYGYNLGLAFQVADDWLDAYGNEAVFGKPIGGDIINNKKCWLTTRVLEKMDAAEKEGFSALMNLPVGTEEQRAAKIAAVKAVYERYNIGDEAKEEIVRLSGKALDYAAKACEGDDYQQLVRFADRLIGRTK